MIKENIITAALRLFLLRGYKSVSLIDVANEVGITKGGIYHYFSSKDKLLHEAVHFFLDCSVGRYTELFNGNYTLHEILYFLLVENTFEEYSKNLIGVDSTCSIDHVHFAIEIVRLFPDIQERVQQTQVFLCTSLTEKIQDELRKGNIKTNLDSEALAIAIVAMLNGQKSLGMYFQSVELRKRILANIWELLRS